MAAVTRTLGPLHLEDLEPHRFEDLVRQLLYDFRPWRDLEATGRSGNDRGFDARGTEIVGYAEDSGEVAEGEEEQPRSVEERQWLIQCKREKAIGPKKIESYLDGLPKAKEGGLYGLIFAAACDFSFETRGRFYDRTRELGFEEVRLWGKAEMEDKLFQPKNDHLLFAYFGVSLQARRRSVKTRIRSRLAMKRKAMRVLGASSHVLMRDGSDDRYPYLDRTEGSRQVRGRWCVYRFDQCGPFGVELECRRHLAFIDDDGEHWDYAERMDDSRPHQDPWPSPEKPNTDRERAEDFRQWDQLLPDNKAWFTVNLVLPYESIVDIDDEGDEFFQGPQIYVEPFTPQGRGPFADFERVELKAAGTYGRHCAARKETRVKVFPRRGEESKFAAPNELA